MKMTMKEARKKAGLTQTQLGEKVGIVYSTISGIEAGKIVPLDMSVFFRIEKALDAIGQIQWDSRYDEADLEIVTRAIKNLRSFGYPVESALIFIAKLFRQGHSSIILKLAGYDLTEVDRLDTDLTELLAGFSPEEVEKIVKILSQRNNGEKK